MPVDRRRRQTEFGRMGKRLAIVYRRVIDFRRAVATEGSPCIANEGDGLPPAREPANATFALSGKDKRGAFHVVDRGR